MLKMAYTTSRSCMQVAQRRTSFVSFTFNVTEQAACAQTVMSQCAQSFGRRYKALNDFLVKYKCTAQYQLTCSCCTLSHA